MRRARRALLPVLLIAVLVVVTRPEASTADRPMLAGAGLDASTAARYLAIAPQRAPLVELTIEEAEYVGWVQAARASYGLPPLLVDGPLTAQAQLHAHRVAACACAYHSPMGEMGWYLTRGWWNVAENVALAGTTWAAHMGIVASTDHREAMLDHRHCGMAVAIRHTEDGGVVVAEWYGGFAPCP